MSDIMTATREVVEARARDGIEQLHLPFKQLDVTSVFDGYELRGALALQARPRVDGLREVFAPNAFDVALVTRDSFRIAREGHDVHAYFYSDPSMLLGSTVDYRLALVEQDGWVDYYLSVAALPYGERLAELLGEGDTLPHASVEVRVTEDEWTTDNNGAVRAIKAMTLFSVQPEVRPGS